MTLLIESLLAECRCAAKGQAPALTWFRRQLQASSSRRRGRWRSVHNRFSAETFQRQPRFVCFADGFRYGHGPCASKKQPHPPFAVGQQCHPLEQCLFEQQSCDAAEHCGLTGASFTISGLSARAIWLSWQRHSAPVKTIFLCDPTCSHFHSRQTPEAVLDLHSVVPSFWHCCECATPAITVSAAAANNRQGPFFIPISFRLRFGLASSYHLDKKRPPSKRGPSCLGSLALRELGWRPNGGVTVGVSTASGEDGRELYGCSAPAAAAALWGCASARAAKLFSINRNCTLLYRTRSCFSSSLAVAADASALPRATECMR